MITQHQAHFTKDLDNLSIHVNRHFSGPKNLVWRAWSESELLDQWWAPRPYRTETKSMDFSKGGAWLYAMVGPDDSKMWCKVAYISIQPTDSFEAEDMFCDEEGNPNPDFPSMNWKNSFTSADGGTDVKIHITFPSKEAMDKIIEMGFEEGFSMGLGNLDELLETLTD